jgi:hypothetical protein
VLAKWFGKKRDLPVTPPEPKLTPEEEAVAEQQQRGDDPAEPRPDDET